jgi:PAS domain S-box-containing protein
MNTEASFQRNEEHLRMAMNGARVGTWEWDMRTNVVKWSDSISDIFGLPPGMFDGRYETYLGLIHPGDREALKARLGYALDNPGEPYRSEHRIIWADGSVHWLSARGNVIRDENGRPIRMAGTTMDITERKTLERELIEAANREQRRLGQDLHDDLGQWLTGIHLEARALSMKLKPKSEADAAHAEKIGSWAGEALDRTRLLVRGMAPAVIEAEGLTAALREIAANTERMSHIRCHCTCDDSLIIHDTEASLQLYRIAQEAISNALRHSQATEVQVNLISESDGRVCLSIRDNGRGTPYPPPRTSGMGLRIMQFRAGLLGGHVDIRPAEGGGTEVVCRFSLKE